MMLGDPQRNGVLANFHLLAYETVVVHLILLRLSDGEETN